LQGFIWYRNLPWGLYSTVFILKAWREHQGQLLTFLWTS
jgi:hypothetical protein